MHSNPLREISTRIQILVSSVSHLHCKKIAKIPRRLESVLTELADLLLIELYPAIQCEADTFHNLQLDLLPYRCIASV